MQDSITHEALEALSKKATRGKWRAVPLAYDDANFVCALVNLYRTGQLILAQPSGDATVAAFEVGQQAYERIGVTPAMREVMDLCKSNRAATAQPSGDEVEAVARAIDGADKQEGTIASAMHFDWVRDMRMAQATAAIAALDAHRGKQACLKARENSDG